MHTVLPRWVCFTAALHISFFLGHHFAWPLGFEIAFCQSLFELLEVALRWEVFLTEVSTKLGFVLDHQGSSNPLPTSKRARHELWQSHPQ